jgi:ribosome-associated protein
MKMAQLMDAKKGDNIQILDVRGICNFTDFFVICAGQSRLQLNAISIHIEQTFKQSSEERPIGREGTKVTNWIVLDYGEVIAHIMNDDVRDFYKLEEIWGDAKVTLWPEVSNKETSSSAL